MAQHADAIAKNRAAGIGAGGIHGEHANQFSFASKLMHQLIGQRALPRAGRASDAKHGGFSRMRKQLF